MLFYVTHSGADVLITASVRVPVVREHFSYVYVPSAELSGYDGVPRPALERTVRLRVSTKWSYRC